MIGANTKILGVLGQNVSHSLSPHIHNIWLKQHNIDAVYLPLATDDIEKALVGLQALNAIGVNVTIPYKTDVYNILNQHDPIAKRLGAVNTVHNGIGYNTDGYGFMQGLERLQPNLDKIVLLGAGGAAAAVVDALSDHPITIVNRSLDKAQALSNHVLGWDDIEQAFIDATLIINSTPFGQRLPLPDLPWHLVANQASAYDLVYGKTDTPFCKAAKDSGLNAIDGLPMLIHQAAKAFEIWFGMLPELAVEDVRCALSA